MLVTLKSPACRLAGIVVVEPCSEPGQARAMWIAMVIPS